MIMATVGLLAQSPTRRGRDRDGMNGNSAAAAATQHPRRVKRRRRSEARRDERATGTNSQPPRPEPIVEPVGYDFGVSRRSFVQGSAPGPDLRRGEHRALAQERADGRRWRGGGGGGGQPVNLDARLHIGADGVITVMTGKVECGQGARAQITQAAAEELGVPASRCG
jgi:CO/xanthine dehydrogenase Mo-binding subunit